MSTTRNDANQGGFRGAEGVEGLPPSAEPPGHLAGKQGVQSLSATFRRIFRVVFLIFVFAVVQMFMLWRVCNTGMKTATSLEHQGLPTLNELASLQEHLAIYRLNSYEFLFAREEDKTAKAKEVETVAIQMRTELEHIKTLVPEGKGRQLASNLEGALDGLDSEFERVRNLVDSDFAAAMKAMDQDIPPMTDQVTAAANALKDFGYQFSGGQANATFDSFGWIKNNAVLFGAGNILVAFGAVMFIRLAARRSRAQLSDTLVRLDQRTQELAGSLSLVHATLEATADGILLIDTAGNIGNFNQQFLKMWRISPPAEILKDKQRLMAYVLPLVERSEKFAGKMEELAAHPEQESFDVLELQDTRVFECCSKPQRIQDRICGRVWSFRDITERRRAQESERLQSAALEAAANAIVITDQNGTIQSVNPAFTALTGYSAQEAAGQNPRLLKSGNQNEAFYRNLWQTISSGQVWSGELTNRRKDGSFYVEEMTITPLRNAGGVIARYIAIKQDITGRKRDEAALVKTSALLEALLQNTTDGIYFKDRECRFVHFSRKMLEHFHLTHPEELMGRTDFDFFSEEHARPAFEAEQEILRTGKPILNLEEKETHLDGRITWVLTSKMAWRDNAGNLIGTMGISRDITQHKCFESRLFQSQKMETVGKLAGGIAHEFNSIMTAILGQCELMLSDLPTGNPLRKNASEIHQAASRAAALTRQLLAYGRKQILQPDVLDLNTVLAGMENTLRHLAGRDVDVQIAPPAGPMLVKADAGQIEQVIVNIVMNAADAMPNGGKLTLETAGVFLDQEYVRQFHDLKAGDFVMLAITDTGAGMTEAVKARIFEPFFTTKGVGQGTGLGLATCHGIIKQSDGHINVYSEPGRGATFKIYLPKASLENKPPGPPLQSPGLPRGTETILLVEDDPALREMAATLLGRLGYTVLPAGNGLEALNVTQQRATGHIDLLFTDVVMPHMSGKELADRMRALHPHTKILFTSAYTETAIVHQGVLNPGIILLQKPFTPSALANKVREVLDNDKPAPPPL